MKNILLITLLGGLNLVLITSQALSQETDFYKASEFYKDGQYKKAITTYEGILDSGKTSGALYYNLGNSYFKDGQLGKAILNYKRAKKLMPRDSDVDFNLKYALSQVKYKSEAKEKGFIKKLVDKYAGSLSLDEIMKIILLTYFLICVFILTGLFLRWPRNRLIWPTALLGIILIFHYFIFMGSSRKYSQVVVVIEDIEAKFEPIKDATVHFNLPEGNTATILEKRDGWVKIERRDGKVGWTENHTIEAI